MIEEEEILEHAAQTGFRLCGRRGWNSADDADDTWGRTFSATWDPNDSNKLFVCSQNGHFRILDISTGCSDDYHVLFRRFSPAYEGIEDDLGKPVKSHWDKMMIVPNKPGEIIFMLGISKVLLYTAIPGYPSPYPKEPVIARTTRGDSPEFKYGTPILELLPHTCRVTSIATTTNGHLMASGDELGNMKICILTRQISACVTSFVNEKRIAQRQMTKHSYKTFVDHPSSKISLKPHGGPIFSIQWLPATIASLKDFTPSSSSSSYSSSSNHAFGSAVSTPLIYYVATGSADRAVRLWKVVCGSTAGLSVTAFRTLDTVPTHVLSMHSCLILGGGEVKYNKQRRTKLFDDINNICGGNALLALSAISTAGTDREIGMQTGSGSESEKKSGNSEYQKFSNVPLDEFVDSAGLQQSKVSSQILKAQRLFEENQDSLYFDSTSHSSVYLAAGTNTGCVYVWKFSYSDLQGDCNIDKSSTSINDKNNMIASGAQGNGDNGGYILHSLLQSSQYPIVQIALSSAPDPDTVEVADIGRDSSPNDDVYSNSKERSYRMVMVTSDTHACVRTHCETDRMDENNVNIGQLGEREVETRVREN